MSHPAPPVAAGHVEPCPRRIRAGLGGAVVLDTERAVYLWEWPFYPQWYVPAADVAGELRGTGEIETTGRGIAEWVDLVVGSRVVERAGQRWTATADPRVEGSVHLEWGALDRWFEEDEQVFVHPRSPYVRVDALRSGKAVRVELEGVVLAESTSPVLVFETGLPTRFYLPKLDVRTAVLVSSDTVTECPYKGTTSQWWSVRLPDRVVPDLAWAYDFPTRQLLPVAGLVAFYDEKVDTYVDGVLRERPVTHFG